MWGRAHPRFAFVQPPPNPEPRLCSGAHGRGADRSPHLITEGRAGGAPHAFSDTHVLGQPGGWRGWSEATSAHLQLVLGGQNLSPGPARSARLLPLLFAPLPNLGLLLASRLSRADVQFSSSGHSRSP